jgi:hypothetical protein
MTWVAAAIVGAGVVTAGVSYLSGQEAAKSAEKAAETAAEASTFAADIEARTQQEALDYLKEREAIPQQFREEALTQLGGLYGLEGGEGSQQELIDQAIGSPLYQSIMGGKEFGEDAIMRSAGMTGGLRSGNVQGNMYEYNTKLQNMALLESYNQQLQGLTGLAGIPSNTTQVAGMMSGIGATQAEGVYGAGMAESLGQVASSQAKQTGTQNMIDNLLGFGELAMMQMYSDRRLKTNIKKIGEINGYNFYSFKWNSIANKMGLTGSTCGCMADEVFDIVSDAVFLKDNFMMVNYSMIGVL